MSYLVKSPFYEIPLRVPMAELSIEGQRMNPILFPDIHTLISKSQTGEGDIGTIQLKDKKDFLQHPTANISLDISAMSLVPTEQSQVSMADTMTSTIGVTIPTTYAEALQVYHLISDTKSGRGSKVFDLIQLKQICSNLGLSKSGNKHEIVSRLQDNILRYAGNK